MNDVVSREFTIHQPMIAILDYGVGNLKSVQNMFYRMEIEAVITGDKKEMLLADKLLLPGVGSFDNCMDQFDKSGLREGLMQAVTSDKKPLLGICAGAQMLTSRSDEGKLDGLGLIDAETVRFSFDGLEGLKIPHMGWNYIQIRKESALFNNLPEAPRFYFVHSYHFRLKHEDQALAVSHYGYEFTCAFQKNNIYGVQFHPEKSHHFGMKVLENFARL